MQLRFGAGTDPGRVRTKNEDRYVADADLGFFAVVDGMGGHAGGELASATIAEAATEFIRESASDTDKTWPVGLDPRLSGLANRLHVAVLVAEQVEQGLIDAEAARTHPLRHVVTRAVSGQADMAVDIHEMEISAGDRLVLCSDGVHGVLTDAEIATLVSAHGQSLDEICRAILDETNSRGGPDNATTIVVELVPNDAG